MTMVFGIRDERGLWPAVFTDADAAAEFKDHQGVPGIVVPIMLDPDPGEPMEAARRAALEFLSPGARTRLGYLRDAPGAPWAHEDEQDDAPRRQRHLIGIAAEPDWGAHHEIELTAAEAMTVAKVAALFLPEDRSAYEVAPYDVDPGESYSPRPSEHPYLWMRIKPEPEGTGEQPPGAHE